MASRIRETPQAAFATARDALARGDWETFFACVDRDELLRIAKNGVSFLLAEAPDDTARALCSAHGFPLEALHAQAQEIVASARAMLPAGGIPDAARLLDASRRHQALVAGHVAAVEGALRSVPDLPAFAAALERRMRERSGGGSVSSRLVSGELRDVAVRRQGERDDARRRRPRDPDRLHEEEEGRLVAPIPAVPVKDVPICPRTRARRAHRGAPH